MRIVFCGDTFPAARSMLRERLPKDEIIAAGSRTALNSVGRAQVLIPMMYRIEAALLRALHPLLVQQWGSGLDGVDLNAARLMGIPVARVPASGANAVSVAEHVILLILSLLRKLSLAQANIHKGRLGEPLGQMLTGRTICVWGLGATALELTRLLHAFGARIVGITRRPTAEKSHSFRLDQCSSIEDKAACLGQTDVLVLCVRLNDATRGLVDTDVLASLPRGAYLVNAARGALIDYRALYAALADGRLAGAGLDVYWDEPISPGDPLLKLPNIITTPHVAGVTERSYTEIADAVALNIERLRRGDFPLHQAI